MIDSPPDRQPPGWMDRSIVEDIGTSVTPTTVWMIDPAVPAALHEQIAANVRRAIGEGRLAAGERLPPAGELAASLRVNANTVLRAYRGLRDEDVLEFRRGRGVRIRPDAAPSAAVNGAVRHLLDVGRRYGYDPAELADLVRTFEEATS